MRPKSVFPGEQSSIAHKAGFLEFPLLAVGRAGGVRTLVGDKLDLSPFRIDASGDNVSGSEGAIHKP